MLEILMIVMLAQTPKEITCKVVGDGRAIHLLCTDGRPKPYRVTVPASEWPEQWTGARGRGSVFRLRTEGGQLTYVPTPAYCRAKFERNVLHSRVGISDGPRNLAYHRPEECRDVEFDMTIH